MENTVIELSDEYPRAFDKLNNSARYRQLAEHFQVFEHLNFEPENNGDHLYLYIKKTNTNTDWLAKELADKAGIKPVDVGYAGRKDRFAITSQWFSLHLPESKGFNLEQLSGEDYQILKHTRHPKKLRKGEIAYNQFKLQLVNFEGSFEDLKTRIDVIRVKGYPNYFGPQRFGHQGKNVDKARDMLSGKHRVKDRNKRSIYLSAARSFLFNQVLKARLENKSWLTVIKGEQLWDESSQSYIDVDEVNETHISQLKNGHLSTTGPLPGDGKNIVNSDAEIFEHDTLSIHQQLMEGIANSRANWHRRSLRVIPLNLRCDQNSLGVEFEFSLPTGAYATSLLREIFSTLKG